MNRRDFTRYGLSCAGLGLMARSHAQDRYPARPVSLVVPFPPGGASDLFARVLSRKLSESLGQPFVVDNRAGATGIIGSTLVRHAKADGYTLLIASNSSQIITPLLKTKPPYDGLNDFDPIMMLGSYPLALQVKPSLPVRSVRELIELAKRQPGKLNFGSIGEGSVTHLAAELFKRQAGVDIVHVPYKGSSALSTALIAGEIDMIFDSAGAGKASIEAKRVVALAVTGDRRSTLLPQVPSLAEAGVPGVDAKVWIGMFGPKGLPGGVVQVYQRELGRLLRQDSEVRRVFADNGTDVVASSTTDFAEAMRRETPLWRTLIGELHLAGN